MYRSYRKLSGLKRNQIKYVFLGTAIGFLGGSTNYPLWYGIPILPVGNILVSVYVLLIAYTIVRYRFMDINLVITRAGIFIVVYSVVLGIPFALAFGYQEQLQELIGKNWWIIPLISSTVLATAGPLLYLYFQKKAEGRLLEEQHEYQSTLRKASMGMGRIKDLKKLLNLIVHIVVRAVKIENSEVYLWHEESKSYVLKASKSFKIIPDSNQRIKVDSQIISMLRKQKEPLVFDELKQKSQDHGDKYVSNVIADMEEVNAALIVPSFIENKLIALIVLGKKRSGKPFSQDDLMVFSILANQSALAIENAMFYEESKRTQEQLFKAEKMATIGTMADGLSHQINNRLHAMGFIAGDAIDTINIKQQENLPEDIKKTLEEVRYSLKRIEENVKQGGEIVMDNHFRIVKRLPAGAYHYAFIAIS
jgi:GAF domain-containing protein